jgi:hypothetical protein
MFSSMAWARPSTLPPEIGVTASPGVKRGGTCGWGGYSALVHIAIFTLSGFTEVDSLMGVGTLNRVKEPDWRRRGGAAIALLAVLICLWPVRAAQATADGPDYYQPRGVAAGTTIPLQAAPRSDAPVLGRIGSAAICLRSLGCQGGLSLEEYASLSEAARQQRLALNPRWCKVAYQGIVGWVPGNKLAESATACTGVRSGVALTQPGSVVRRGQIRGDKFADYLVQGRAGQTLKVELNGSHPQNYFNLTPPGSDWSMFVGSTSGDQVERVLPVDGLYLVRVYLMRAAARRNATSQYTLTLALSGQALRARDPAQDALVAGTPFHARATIACRQAMDPARATCEAAVIRYQRAGSASVEIRWTEGPVQRMRWLLFVDGRVLGSDATQAPRQDGVADPYRIDVGPDEHYVVPQALVLGG